MIQLVPVVAAPTNEEKSILVGLRLDLIEGEPRIAVPASPHGYFRRCFRRFVSCLGSDGRRGNSELMFFKQLVGKNARRISRLILTLEILFSFVWIVRLRFSSHSVAQIRLQRANRRQIDFEWPQVFRSAFGLVRQHFAIKPTSGCQPDATVARCGYP
ncbi:hypothetical protein P0D88_45875 [Paraburkholderia sp. RL18-103-BIB-C]|jgi:hypothetical protein|uniref:hypothetical protein n=1 Tax=unclassified Paraburkholderia TaxID=2615204 RepID=UPI0038B87A05